VFWLYVHESTVFYGITLTNFYLGRCFIWRVLRITLIRLLAAAHSPTLRNTKLRNLIIMNADHWKTLLILDQGDTLKFEGSRTKGFMEEEDIENYSVLGADGGKKGDVVINDHTAVKGFSRRIQFTQKDVNGKTLKRDAYTVN